MIWIWISFYDPDYKTTMRLSIIHYTNKTEKLGENTVGSTKN